MGGSLPLMCTRLTSLSVSHFDPQTRERTIAASKFLATLTNLTKLKIVFPSGRKFEPDLLKDLTNLQALEIQPAFHVSSLTHLKQLTRTSALSIRSPFSGLTELVQLRRFDCTGSPSSAKYVSHLTNLRVLVGLEHCPGACLPVTLEKLVASDCAKLGTVSHLTNLTYLGASRVSSTGFSLLTNLTCLLLWDCHSSNPQPDDLVTLTNLTKLDYCGSVPDKIIEQLPKLVKLRRKKAGATAGRFDLIEHFEAESSYSSSSSDDFSESSEDEFVSEESAYDSMSEVEDSDDSRSSSSNSDASG